MPAVSSSEDSSMARLVGFPIMGALIVIVNGYNTVVHLIFKDLCKAMGKLIMLYSLMIIIQCLVIFVILAMYNIVALNSQITCKVIIYVHGYNCKHRRLCHLHPYPFCLHFALQPQCLQRGPSSYFGGTLRMHLVQWDSFLPRLSFMT